jgi:hypothetical protein
MKRQLCSDEDDDDDDDDNDKFSFFRSHLYWWAG